MVLQSTKITKHNSETSTSPRVPVDSLAVIAEIEIRIFNPMRFRPLLNVAARSARDFLGFECLLSSCAGDRDADTNVLSLIEKIAHV